MHDDGAEEDGREQKHLMEDRKKDRENEPNDQVFIPRFSQTFFCASFVTIPDY